MITGADLDRIERDARENRPLTGDILALAQLLLHTADVLLFELHRATGWHWTAEGPIVAEVYGKHGPFVATGYVLGLHGCPGLWPSGVEQLADNRGLFHSPTVSLRISPGSRFVQEGAVRAFLREVSK